jgi:hypothetical protein
MKILIISLPRTGSTSLMIKISKEHKINYIFEPFNPLNPTNMYIANFKNSVVKTIIFHKPKEIDESERLDWLIDLTSKFDQTVLLSRKDTVACAESWAYLNHRGKALGFDSKSQYLWEKTPNYETSLENVKVMNEELSFISTKTNIPITYYEEIFDLNDPSRLRKGNRKDSKKNII